MSKKTKLESVSLISNDSRSTLNGEDNDSSIHYVSQTIDVTADSVLIKKERLGRNKHGEIFKGERVSMYSELGIQAVLINEMNLNTNPKESMQFIHERTAAPIFGYSKNSPHIAKCYGLHMNSKGTQIWLVTEFLPFSVYDLIESGPLEEQQTAFIIAEVIKGLDYLHSLGIRHGDVVSCQVMLSQSGEVKLAGFHLANDTLDASQLPGTTENDDSGFKDDILSLGKMAIELIHGPQVSDEQVLVEKEIPSLINQLSQNFRRVITSCLHKDPKQRPTAAQLLNDSFIKKMRKVTTLKDHKLLFNRCKRFKRSLMRRKNRNRVPGEKITKQQSATPVYESDANSASDLHLPGSLSSIQTEAEAHGVLRASDLGHLPIVTWNFDSKDTDHFVQVHQRQHYPISITFQTVTVTTEERLYRLENGSTEKVFKGTFMDDNQPLFFPCLVREIDISKLSQGAVNRLCCEMVTPLFRTGSPNIVKVLHAGFSEKIIGGNSEQLEQGTRLHIITELFFDCIHDLQELGPLEEDLIAWILREVLKALNYLHSQRIAYGNMSTHHILFSIASGSLEIKLDHTHTVIDGLEAKTGSETDFNHNLKADIWNLGVIAMELAHSEPPSVDSLHQIMEYTAPTLSSVYSKHFTDFVASCLQKVAEKRPTSYDLLQSSFIRRAKETCGLESVFDLYWKHKLKIDKQLYGEVNDNFMNDDIKVPPNVSWSFDEPLQRPFDEPQIALPPPPLQNIWDQNETKDVSILQHESATHDSKSPQPDQTVLMNHQHQRTQISASTPHIMARTESEWSSYKQVTSTPAQHHSINEINTSMSSLPREQQPIRSKTQHRHRHGRSRSSRPTSYVNPPNLQGAWWMYPPWWLPPPWWLCPPAQPMPRGQYRPPPQGQEYYPPPGWHHSTAKPMADGRQGSPSQAQGMSQPWWLYPPWWQQSQQHLGSQQHLIAQPPADERQVQHEHQFKEPVPQHHSHQPRANPHQQQYTVPQSQELPLMQSTTEGHPPRHESQYSDHKELSLHDDHPPPSPQHEELLAHEQLLVWQSKTGDHPATEEDPSSEVPLLEPKAGDKLLQHEELLAHEQSLVWQSKMDDHSATEEDLLSEVPLLEPKAGDQSLQHEAHVQPWGDDSLLQHEGSLNQPQKTADNLPQHGELHPPQPILDDIQIQRDEPLLESPPMQPITNNSLVPEEEAMAEEPLLQSFPQHGEDHPELQPPQPTGTEIQHEDSLLESPPMQPIANDNLVLEEEAMAEVPLLDLQPTADSLPQYEEDHLKLHPPQPILDDIQRQEDDEPLLESPPMQLTSNNSLILEEEAMAEEPLLQPTIDILPQHEEDHLELHPPRSTDIEIQHVETLLESPPMQLIANNSQLLEEEAVVEVPLLQPTADSLQRHGEDYPELHPPMPTLDDIQIQHEDSLLEKEAMVEVPLPDLQPTVNNLPQYKEDHHKLHPPQLILDDIQRQEDEEPLFETPPMQLITNNSLVLEEKAKAEVPLLQPTADSFPQHGEDRLQPPQPTDIEIQHEDSLLESPPMQPIANDNLVLEEEAMAEVPLLDLQPTADSLPQYEEDRLKLHPPQPILDDIQRQEDEEPLLESPPMQLTSNNSLVLEEEAMAEEPLLQPTIDILPQHEEDHLELHPPRSTDIEIQHVETLESPPMQLIADNSQLLEEEAVVEVPLLQPTADSLQQHGEDHPELHPPMPTLDDVQIQHEDSLLESPPMQPKADNKLALEKEAMVEVPLPDLQPTVDNLPQYEEDHHKLHPPQLILDDIQRQEDEEPLFETPPMQTITNNSLVLEEKAKAEVPLLQPTVDSLPQHGEDHVALHPPQPTLDDIQIQHEDSLLESPPMQLIANDNLVLEEKVMTEEPLLQPTAVSFPQHGEDHLEVQPSQLTLDDIEIQYEYPFLEAPPMQPIVNDNLVLEEETKAEEPCSLPQPKLDDIQIKHEDTLVESPPMQLAANNNLLLEEEAMAEEPLLQPTADDQSSLHEDNQLIQSEHELGSHSPQPIKEVDTNDYTLQELMRVYPLEEHQIATLLLKVVQLLDNLHSQGKVHNDISIANITLSESGKVKLVDSKVAESILQMVPEVNQLITEDHKADIWSLGITAVEIANGEPPDASMLELLFGNSFITPQFLDNDDFSEEFEDFISSCLKSDPEERSSAQELLEHDFLMSASPDISAVSNKLISLYKDWKKTLPQPEASDLPGQSEDHELQQPSPLEDNDYTTLHDDTLSEVALSHVQPATDDQPPQRGDAVSEEAEPIINGYSPQQHDNLMAQLLPVLESIADHSHAMREDDPLAEAPMIQSTTDDDLHVPLLEDQLAQKQKPKDNNNYSLQELMRVHPLEEHQIATILLKVVQHLDDLHSQGKVHNDVSIANITLSESGEVKLVDSKVAESILQMVPEVNQLIEDDSKADIWSLGITAVEIANGEPPDASMLELLFGNSFITPQFLDSDDFSEEFEDFICSCLKSDPDERSSTQELLEHDFLSSANPDIHAVIAVDKLISQYKDWRKAQ